MRPPILALALWVLAAAALRADVRDPYVLAGSDFQGGAGAWTASASGGPATFVASRGPSADRSAVRAIVAPGARGTLALDAPFAGTSARPGDKVEMRARVWLGSDATGGDVWIEVASVRGAERTPVARSTPLAPHAAPRGRWLTIATEPLPGLDGRLAHDATGLELSIHVETSGAVFVDDVRAGRFGYGRWDLANASFEAGDDAWTETGTVSWTAPADRARRGTSCALLTDGVGLMAEIPVNGGERRPRPLATVEAGAWVFVEPSAALGALPDPARAVTVGVTARVGGASVPLAEGRFAPTAADAGAWRWVETQPLGTGRVPLGSGELEISVSSSVPANVRVDDVQVGEAWGVDGNPRRMVLANYLGRYRSPLFPGSGPQPGGPELTWRNWYWTAPPFADPNETGFGHDPECATSASCLRSNLRRDVAVSVEGGEDDLPLAGAYDSRDPDVVRWHARLAAAAGVDGFVYVHQGHALAAQNAGWGIDPLNEQAFDALLDAVEAPGVDLSVAPMYEPKVHFLGWVQGEPTFFDKLRGIREDLEHLVATYADREGILKRDGRMVVFLFRNDLCDDAGRCMEDGDWRALVDAVQDATGRELCLIADGPPTTVHPFRGVSRWRLVANELLRYDRYADVVAGSPAWPPPEVATLFAHAASISAVSRAWVDGDDRDRLFVPIAWPGFDDTGVAGWSSPNLIGADGGPLGLRVLHDMDGAFFRTTLRAAVAAGSDWIQVATWNDWNELTQIEPMWRRPYFDAVRAGTRPPAGATGEVFGRLLETYRAAADFKGERADDHRALGRMHRITARYLRSAAHDPAVVEYD